MSDEARVIGASYGVTEGLDAPLYRELAPQRAIRELLNCIEVVLPTLPVESIRPNGTK
jgi:hypothetical protein